MVFLLDNLKLILFAIFIGFLTIFCLFAKWKYSYWDRKGIKYLPNFSYLFGHFKSIFLQKEFIGDFITKIYRSTNEPFIGIYSILFRPILLVRDPELIRLILIKDFQYFSDRAVHYDETYDAFSGNLFSLPGQKWKNLRGKLSPAFTSGKLKEMFSTLFSCGSSLQNYLEKCANQNKLLDVRDIAARYATNVIASVGFGIEVDTIANKNDPFRIYGEQIFSSNFSTAFRWFLFFYAPKVMSLLRIKIVNSNVENFIYSIVKQNLEHREKKNVIRKDFFQLLIQLRNSGTVQLDDQWETVIKADENQKTLTLDEIAAQTFIFFAASFETSSSTLSFCLYELAKNPDIQMRVDHEVDSILKEFHGEITYESILKMKYLEACIDGENSFWLNFFSFITKIY